MRKAVSIVFLIIAWALPAAAQNSVWVQIEARPTLREAQDRARAYSNAFTDVAGFQLNTGWYAIALGPFTGDDARARLQQLRRDRLIPADSYVSDGGAFRQQFWPIGAPPRTAPLQTAMPLQQPAALPDETPAEARRAERALTPQERQKVQEALQWEGHYTSAIDGAFGPGTRNAMASYQLAMGYDPTGVLTSRQRAELLTSYADAIAALGLQQVDETAAGIRITLPAGMVAFQGYEPPFVHYAETGGSGVRALLISQKGDRNTLFGLYDVMQSLEIVPLTGPRERTGTSFEITGTSRDLHSYTYAELKNGTIKGFTLAWRPEDEKLLQRAAQIMRESFAPYGDTALDETLGTPDTEQSADLLSGLEIRRPTLSRTGFFIDGTGTVLTTAEGLAQCPHITVGDEFEADLAARDDALDLAVLRPREALSPIGHAAFQTGVPRLRSDVAVAGFPYGDVLDLPVLTYGTLADLRGLSGEETVSRLSLDAMPGDMGGPVFDATGAVLGMLVPVAGGARSLPGDVSFAATVPAIAEFLSANGLQMSASDNTGALDPADLAARAADMTVLVSCWN